MTRVVVIAALVFWAGATLLLAEFRRLSRPSLAERLGPYAPGGNQGRRPSRLLSAESFRDVAGPLVTGIGQRVAGLFGVGEPLELRLRRIHSNLDPTSFRLRQLAWMGAGLGVGLVLAALGLPLPLALFTLLGLPVLAFLVLEQALANASSKWQARLSRELPVVSEQLAMLLGAGFSLGSALNRLAARSHGACGADLRTVMNRIRQGLPEIAALREWADLAKVDGINRLVAVLSLNSQSSDLGRLVSNEARLIRRDLQRQVTEALERRGQQVWVPVSVATLVPGVIFLAIPFIAALRLFANV